MPTDHAGMDVEESIEISKIYSVSGLLTRKTTCKDQAVPCTPPHSIGPGTDGGGRRPKRGDLACHRGILFLDELPEFSRAALETLRQPLEDREVTVSRVEATVTYPANFSLWLR